MLFRAVTERLLPPSKKGEERLTPWARDNVYHGGYLLKPKVLGVKADFNPNSKTADIAPYILSIARGSIDGTDTTSTIVESDVPLNDVAKEMESEGTIIRMEHVQEVAATAKIVAGAVVIGGLLLNHVRQSLAA